MAAPIVPFTTAKNQVMEYLNCARTYGTFNASPAEKRWTSAGIDDVIINADVEFQRAVCETDKHPRRIEYYQAPVSVSFGAVLPSHIGPLGPVQVTYSNGESWAGVRATSEWIRIWKDDLTARSGTGGMTAGGNTLARAAGWLFTQSDIGKTITVATAGTSGGTLTATITAVDTVNQTATVSPAAVGTVTGAATAWAGNNEYGGLEACEGHWDIVEERAYFIGTALLVTPCEIARGTTSALKAPLEYINGIVGWALGMLLAKDGDHMDAASFYMQYANMCLQLVREGKMTLPPLMQFEPGRTD
ncbi:MAG TPA: hypothetical protein VN476_03475 [Pyrinomonadaceae bacterium]|nr:hypothetical protein [Pyrinomonadaceae bacterium]